MTKILPAASIHTKKQQIPNKAEYAAKLLRIAVSILLFVAFTPFLQAQPGSITISGQVSSHPHQLPPHTTILAKDPDTQQTLAQTQTDENGYYSLEILTTHTGHTATSEEVFSLLPNPFGSHATLVAWLPSAGNYTLAAYDLFGRMIISETLQAQPGLNHIPVELPPAKGLVIIALQGENFRKTLKALQNNEQGQYENQNHKLNIRLIQGVETQQNQAINWQYFAENDYFDVENQGFGSLVGHDRFAGFDYRHNGFDPGTQGSEMYGSETQQYLTIMFLSDNHEQKDTTVTFTNHEINKNLNQTPDTVNSTYNLYVYDDQGNVENANITVHNVENTRTKKQKNDNPLFSGTTNNQGTFTQEYEVQEWPWPGQPTIRNIENLHTNIESDPHKPYERVDAYQQNLELEAELERIIQEQTATITGNIMSLPHNLPPLATIHGTHEGNTIGTTTTDTNGNYTLTITTPEEINYVTLLYSSDNHEQKDTTVTFTNHEINKNLNQTPDTVNSTYNLYVYDDQGNVENANITVHNVENTRTKKQKNDNPLFSGTTNNQGTFTQEYEVQEWPWPGQPTIRNIENLHTNIESDPHKPYERVDAYQQNLELEAELQRLTGMQTATVQINLTNTPMNQSVTNAPITVTNEYDDEVGSGHTNSNGQLLLELLRGYEVQGNDTIYDYENLIFNVSRTHHEDKTFTKPFDDYELEKVLQQIQYESTASLSVTLTSQPLGFAPSNINISASYNEQELDNAEMMNGEANLGIDYDFYINNADTLRLINQEPITQPLIIQAISETHEDKEFQKEFAQNMTITSDLQQIPQQKNAYIHGEVTEQGTNQALENVNVTLKEQQEQEYQETQTTNTNQQGQYEFNMPYAEYMNPNDPEDYQREPSHIKLKFKKNTYQTTTTAPKETQTEIQHNQELESLLQEYQITIQPYTFDNAHMEDVLNEPYELHIRNTTTNQVTTTQQTGNQPLQITLQGEPGDELKIWHNHSDLAEYIVIEHPDQEWTDTNIGNNRPTRLWEHTQPFDTLTVTLNNLVNHQYDPNTPLELYTPRYSYEVSGYGGGGETVYFNGPIVHTMLGDRHPVPGIKNWKYEEHIDMMFINWRVIHGDFWNNNTPISQENLDQMMNIAENVINHTYSASGRERLPVQYHIVNSEQDSIVQEAYDRDWERTSTIRRQFGPPGNSMIWDPPNLRIKYGTARFNEQAVPSTIQEEVFEHMFGVRDPVVGSSSQYIGHIVDGEITLNKLGHTMATVSASADVGTVFLPANTTNNKNFNYELKKQK